MRVLVTGGTGVVGKPAVDHLLGRGHTVRLLSRNAERDAKQWPERVEAQTGSIGDAETVAGAATGCDAVLHIAGIVAEDPPEVTFERINVEGTRLLLQEAVRAGVKRFVYVSSLGADRGASDYHRSKLAAEELVRGFPGSWAILRPGNVYGPGDEVISLLLKLVRTLPAVPVVGNGDQPFQPIWADDLGRAIALAMEREPSGEVLEMAGTERTTMNELLDLLGEITDRRPPRIPVPGFLAQLGASTMERMGFDVPVNRDQLIMLQEENTIDSPERNALVTVFDITPTPLREGLRELADSEPEQLPSEGVGALHRQRYWADITGSRMDAAELLRLLRREFSTLTPDGVMEVGVEPGTPVRLEEGATLTMEIPLRGTMQVRVEEVSEHSVTLATLGGHHLAGVIRFSTRDFDDGRVRFEICSYTRAATWMDALGRELFGRLVQVGAWRQTVQNVVERSGGEAVDGVHTEEDSLSEREAERMEQWAEDLVMRRRREESAEA